MLVSVVLGFILKRVYSLSLLPLLSSVEPLLESGGESFRCPELLRLRGVFSCFNISDMSLCLLSFDFVARAVNQERDLGCLATFMTIAPRMFCPAICHNWYTAFPVRLGPKPKKSSKVDSTYTVDFFDL